VLELTRLEFLFFCFLSDLALLVNIHETLDQSNLPDLEMYKVFMGAPSRAFLLSNHSENATYEWRTVSVTVEALNASAASGKSEPVLIPPDIYEAASTRISEFYQNTIFHDDEDEPEDHGKCLSFFFSTVE